MKRAILGVLVGAAAFFIWGAVSWMVLPFHNKVLKSIPNEQLITDNLFIDLKEPGIFLFPMPAEGQSHDSPEFAEKIKKGPLGLVAFCPQGKNPPMGGREFGTSFLIGLIGAAISLLFLNLSRRTVTGYFARVLMVTLLGLVSWATVDLSYWNWFSFPTDYTLVVLFDRVSSFLVLGLAVAGFVSKNG